MGLAYAAVILPLLVYLSTLHIGRASAQQVLPDQKLIGTWFLVVVDNILPDGSRVHLYGPDPQGMLTFDPQGRYALQIYRAERTKFASGDKSKGTPEENSAAVLGSNAHFGKYSVDATAKTITFRIEHASFPNWDGTEQRRAFSISEDELSYTVPAPTSGGAAIGQVTWKRAQ